MNYLIEEKEYNKNHSKRRIVIEHTICKVKKYKILADVFTKKQIEKIQQGIRYSIRPCEL